MTLPSASRADSSSADNSAPPAASEPPSEAVTLSDLIADAGPLPVDAALECLQRVAERLEGHPPRPERPLGPSDILIDDNGEIWLEPARLAGEGHLPPACPNRESLDDLGRLLLYLTTADGCHLHGEARTTSASVPESVSALANRLSSPDGVGYASYGALAADAASLRDQSANGTTKPPLMGKSMEASAPVDVAMPATECPSAETSALESALVSNAEPPRDAAVAAPMREQVPAGKDESEATPSAQDIHQASSSGRATWLALGVFVMIMVCLLLWWIGI